MKKLIPFLALALASCDSGNQPTGIPVDVQFQNAVIQGCRFTLPLPTIDQLMSTGAPASVVCQAVAGKPTKIVTFPGGFAQRQLDPPITLNGITLNGAFPQ